MKPEKESRRFSTRSNQGSERGADDDPDTFGERVPNIKFRDIVLAKKFGLNDSHDADRY